MTTKEIKEVLADKLQSEGTYFQKSDIKAQKYGKGYKIVIKDYEHIEFIIKYENDDFGSLITLWRKAPERKTAYLIHLEEGQNDNNLYDVLLNLGYYIGTRF